MNFRRLAMDEILKRITLPFLRERGFKGSYPHLYRDTSGHVDLLMFQFRSDESSFMVEISYADPERRNIYYRPDTAVKKLRVTSTSERYRLGGSNAAKWKESGFSSRLNHARRPRAASASSR